MSGRFSRKADLIGLLKENDEIGSSIVYHKRSFELPPKFEDVMLPESISSLLKANGIHRLFSHQIEALKFFLG